MLNKKKVVITIIGIIVLMAIIAILTKFLTNRKEAVYVSNEETNLASNQSEIQVANSTDTNTWNISTQTENTTQENAVNNTNETSNTAKIENNINETNTQNTIQDEHEHMITENNTTVNNTNKSNTTQTNTTAQNTKTASKDSKDVKGVIWLTFDDGPSSTSTPKILDILKKYDVKATFFILNYSDANEKYVKREVAEGHTIGIHGYSHEYSKIYKSKQAYLDNIYKLQEKIQKSTGIKTMYTRFPGGSSNTVSRRYKKGIMTELTKEMLSRGFKYFDWNISSGDAGGAKTSSDVYRNVTRNLSKKRGNLVLCHDFANNKKTIGALEDIIKYGKKNGYVFKAIDDNTPMYGQHINN